MPRVSKAKQFEMSLRDSLYGGSGVKAKGSTFRGVFGYEASQSVFQQVQQVLRPGLALRFEIPTRNHPEAYLVQEMRTVSSRLDHAMDKLASDCTQDSNGNIQPFCIDVNESLPKQREKIFIAAYDILKRTKLGLKGKQRVYRSLWTGDCIGQPVYAPIGAGDTKYRLVDVVNMPTWEMHYDKRTGFWEQRKADNFSAKPIARWDSIPDYMVRNIHNEDDNQPYGRSELLKLVVNYRQYIASIEDLYVAARTRAPRRLVHYLGSEDGTWRVSDKALKDYKKRNELGKPRTIVSDYYLSKNFEEVKALAGDASGLRALLDVVEFNEAKMLEDMGLPADPKSTSGRGVSDSVDIAYAQRINSLRMEDNPYITELLRKGLLLEGFDDVDLDVTIPPLGETESLRWARVWQAYANRQISYGTAVSMLGMKNAYAERRAIEEDVKWLDKLDLPLMGNEMTNLNQPPGVTASGSTGGSSKKSPSEKPSKGGNGPAGVQRRAQQKRAGKKTPSGV